MMSKNSEGVMTIINNRFFNTIVLALLAALCACSAFAAEKPRLSIQRFDDRSGAYAPASAITDMMTTELVSADLFTIVEREKIGMATGEQSLADAGLMDESTTPERGKLLGAEFTMTGAITEWRTDAAGAVIPVPKIGGIGGVSSTATVMLDIRIINNRTGEVIMVAREQGSSNKSMGAIATRYGGFGGGKTGGIFAGATHKVVLNVIGKIKTEGLLKMQAASKGNTAAEAASRGANVLQVDAKCTTATIDGGLGAGIRKGHLFAVYKTGNVIKDLNGNVLGEEKNFVAVLQVVKAQEAYATCTVLKGKGFQRGDKVQRIGKADEVAIN